MALWNRRDRAPLGRLRKPFYIVRVQPLGELFDIVLSSATSNNAFRRVPPGRTVDRIILPIFTRSFEITCNKLALPAHNGQEGTRGKTRASEPLELMPRGMFDAVPGGAAGQSSLFAGVTLWGTTRSLGTRSYFDFIEVTRTQGPSQRQRRAPSRRGSLERSSTDVIKVYGSARRRGSLQLRPGVRPARRCCGRSTGA
jgi:hypothetical protein